MNIRSKLSRLLGKRDLPSRDNGTVSPRIQPSGPALKDRLNALSALQTQLATLTDAGEIIGFDQLRNWQPGARENKRVFRAIEKVTTDTFHGSRSLQPKKAFNSSLLAKITGEPRLAEFQLHDALFIDIEATGLSHGAGTLAFMIGLGWYESDNTFHLEQIVLKDPNDEADQLKELKHRLEEKAFLVSFNGKSYDLSVLQSRMVLHRLYSPRESEMKLTPHIDLLHLYRAIWGKSIPNCKLGTLEKTVLQWERKNDIPGAIVPSLYFAYLQSGDARTIDPVLKHNRWDILSMVSLLFALSEDITRPQHIEEDQRLIQLGHLLNRRGEYQNARNIVDLLLQRRLNPGQKNTVLHMGIKSIKSLKQHHLLYPLLHTLTENFPGDSEGWIERSKYEEHRLKDYQAALESARKACELERIISTELDRRIQRLTRRVSGSAVSSSQEPACPPTL